jgi:hypothetical protein
MFQVPLGIFKNPALPYMRVGSHIPILVVLALVFVIPHDPSTRIKPDQVGADGYTIVPTLRRSLAQQEALFQRKLPTKVLFRAARIAARRAAVEGSKAAMGRVSWKLSVSPPSSPTLPAPRGNCSFTTVEELRAFYGPKQNWWGDFDARQTRELYHSLLPTNLLDAELQLPGGQAGTVEERARMAVAARRAAKMYARERGVLPVSLASQLLDGVRVFCARGTWQPDGLSEEQIVAKYAKQLGATSLDDLDDEVYYTILRKSCTSNFYIDSLVGLSEHADSFI